MVSHLTRTARTCKLNLPINEGQGSTIHDSSGYGNHGTIYGATWVNGSYGYGLYFDGVDDYVSLGTSSTLKPQTITVMAWFNTLKLDAYGVILQSGKNWDDVAGVTMRVHRDGYLNCIVAKGADNDHCSIGSSHLSSNTWYLGAVTVDGTNMRGYLNGSEFSSCAMTSVFYDENTVIIGRQSTDNWNNFYGTIAEVLIYNRAWTADEVLSYYNATKGRFGL